MKKIIISLLSIFVVLLSSCDPIVENKDMGGLISPDDIDISVQSSSPGSNEIVMKNKTIGAAPYWDYIVGTSANNEVTTILPFVGDVKIKFTAIGDAGVTTVERIVTVTELVKPVPVEWFYFAGKSNPKAGQIWVWDGGADGNSAAYGTAGYGNNDAPGWSVFKIGDKPSGKLIDGEQEMVFDLNAGANFTRRKSDGSGAEKGTFSFDMTKGKKKADGTFWSIGELKFSGTSILTPSSTWNNGGDIVYIYDIIKLTETEMVLAYAPPSTPFEEWAEATFWKFKTKQ